MDLANPRNSLSGLHDIVLPQSVSWMPDTAAAWLLLAALAIAFGLSLLVGIRRYRANAYRRDALKVLSYLESRFAADSQAAARALPALLKRTALVAFPRHDVAALSGDAWLNFLDDHYNGADFRHGTGVILPTVAYGSGTVSKQEFDGLAIAIRRWIRNHRA